MKHWLRWMGFATLCLLESLHWVMDESVPRVLPPLLEAAFDLSLAGAMLVGIAFARTGSVPTRNGWGRCALWGACLFGAPATLQQLPYPHLLGSLWLAGLAVVPIVIAVAFSYFGEGKSGTSLAAPLAGLAGVLLVLPLRVPSAGDGVIFLVIVICIGVSLIGLHEEFKTDARVFKLAAAAVGGAAALGVASLAHENAVFSAAGVPAVLLRASVDALLGILLLWLIRELRPNQFSTKFLLVPLLVVMQGLILEGTNVDLRLIVGLLMIMVGGARLLMSEPLSSGEKTSVLSLR